MGTRSRRPSHIIPSQCVELNRSSPARPLNKVATIPGYSFSNKTWTTTGWHQVQHQTMSPEIANLTQQLNCPVNTVNTDKASTNTSMSEDILLITIDDEDTVLTEKTTDLNTDSGINLNDNEKSAKELVTNPSENDESQSSVLADEASQRSEDSTMELLHDFNPNVIVKKQKHTRDIEQCIPSDITPAKTITEYLPEKEKVVAPVVKSLEPTSRNSTPVSGDPIMLPPMELSEPTGRDSTPSLEKHSPHGSENENENENEIKNNIKSEASDMPGIKEEPQLDVKLENANVKLLLSDSELKLEVQTSFLKRKRLKMNIL